MSFAVSLATAAKYVEKPARYWLQLEQRRPQLPSRKLGIDILLTSCGIPQSKQKYPPKSQEQAVALAATIEETASANRLAKSLALYYAFLDYQEGTAEHYAEQVWLSRNKQNLVRGLWSIDRGDFDTGLPRLGEVWELELASLPSAITAIHEYVIQALQTHSVSPLIISYIEAKSLESQYSDTYINALIAAGTEPMKVLESSRIVEHGDTYLAKMGQAVVNAHENAKPDLVNIAQLPCSLEEWASIISKSGWREDPNSVGARLVYLRELSLGAAGY